MKEARRHAGLDIRDAAQFDDEITLPLRIVCERKPDTSGSDLREPSQRPDSRSRKETQNPVHAP